MTFAVSYYSSSMQSRLPSCTSIQYIYKRAIPKQQYDKSEYPQMYVQSQISVTVAIICVVTKTCNQFYSILKIIKCKIVVSLPSYYSKKLKQNVLLSFLPFSTGYSFLYCLQMSQSNQHSLEEHLLGYKPFVLVYYKKINQSLSVVVIYLM